MSATEEAECFLTESQLCARLHINRRTALRWRNTGDGPAYIRAGGHRVLYRSSVIERWLAERTFPHRAAEAVAETRRAKPAI